VPEEGSCRDHFHALLLLEGEIPGVPGTILHFYAVATYVLQHPDSMNYTADALAGLRAGVAAALDGKLTTAGLRSRSRRVNDWPVRVTRRAGEPAVNWHRGKWPITVADVCTADTFGAYDTVEEYEARILRWARSVLDTLDNEGISDLAARSPIP
jgi:hypothetical protein